MATNYSFYAASQKSSEITQLHKGAKHTDAKPTRHLKLPFGSANKSSAPLISLNCYVQGKKLQ